jgi:PKD repeat protein
MRFYLALILLISSSIVSGQSVSIHFSSGDYIPEKNMGTLIEDGTWDSFQTIDNEKYIVIQFKSVPGIEIFNSMEKLGVKVLQYIPENAYIVRVNHTFNPNLLKQFDIRSVFQIHGKQKLHFSLLNEAFYPPHIINRDGTLDLNILPYEDFDFDLFIELLKKNNIEIKEQIPGIRLAIASVLPKDLMLVASLPFIRYMEPVDPEPLPENYTGRTMSRSNALAVDYGAGRHYDGTGMVIGHQDDGDIQNDHPDWKGRVSHFASVSNGDHGDHIAGTLIGAGNRDPKGRGTAYGAHEYYRNYPDISNNATQHYQNDNVRVVSSSYGNGLNAGYTAYARTHDLNTINNPGLIFVFSAGNSGSNWFTITGGHKQGKNVIAVAALNENDQVVGFSSRGPGHDGRIKPDISAKGSNVYSTTDLNSSGYTYKSGTSMACPHLAGTLTQVYHAYKSLSGQTNISAALMRGLLFNTADDKGNKGPDYTYGWGRVNGLRAVKVLESGQYFVDSVVNNASNNHIVVVPQGTKQIRVMVSWLDPAAAAGATKALINDLDMKLTDPSASNQFPWVLDQNNPGNAATTGVDTLNNMEQVVIDNPQSGNYTLNVKGSFIATGQQKYWVIYEFVKDEINVTYPIGGEGFNPGETEKIRWYAPESTLSQSIDYSIDSGNTWTNIVTGLPANDRFYDWTVPNELTGKALIRVSRGNISGTSSAVFSIIGIPGNLGIVWSCGDSLKLKWDSVPGATMYEVSMLGQYYMDSIGRTSALNFLVTNVNTSIINWFSVKAIGPDMAIGRRAIALQKYPGDTNCIALDATVENVIRPATGYFPSCQVNDSSIVGIRILNNGINTISNIPIGFQLNGGAIVTDTLFDSLASAESYDFFFQNKISINSIGTHILKSWTALPGDQNIGNDTFISQIIVYFPGNVNIPYTQNFDNFQNCSTAWGCADISCTLAAGWFNLPNVAVDSIDWRSHSGSTASSNTGPSSDHTTGNSTGKYLYLEGSGNGGSGCQNKEALVLSPCFDLMHTNQPRLGFWYHMYGSAIGDLHVDVMSDGIWYEDVMPVISGEQGNQWFEQIVDLSAFAGKTINIRFRGTTGAGWQADMALDDINITTLPTSRYSASHSITCPGDTVYLYDSSYFANTRKWIFNPATISFINGTTDTSQNPVIVFNDTGYYRVQLITFNETGSDTLTLDSFFNAGPHVLNLDIEPFAGVCSGDTVHFLAGSGYQSYQYFVNNVMVQSSPDPHFDYVGFIDSQKISVQAVINENCITSVTDHYIRVSHLKAQIVAVDHISCFGANDGLIEIEGVNGIAPYQYTWSTGQNSSTIYQLAKGNYAFTITDTAGCSDTGQAVINEPSVLISQISTTDVLCTGEKTGSAIIFVSGGTPGYNFNWSNGSQDTIANQLDKGLHYVTITDNNLCVKTDTVQINGPDSLKVILVNKKDADCNGSNGEASVSGAGGTPPYQFNWSNGANGTTVSNLTAGIYTVTITDSNQCMDTLSIQINAISSNIIITLTGTGPACHNDSTGTVQASATGNTGPVTFQWSNNQTGTSLTNLPAGKYVVTVTDSLQCSNADSISLINPLPLVTDSILSTEPGCFGETNGSIAVQSSGGTGTLNYHWNTGNMGPVLQNIGAGLYSLTVSDSNQCQIIENITLSQPDSLQIKLMQLTNQICLNTQTGVIRIQAMGGTSPYQYQWSNGSQNALINNLKAGIYSVTVTDSNACTVTDSFFIGNYPVEQIGLQPDTNITSCEGDTVTLTAQAGFTQYVWNNGQTGNSIQVTKNGNFSVQAIDTNSCDAYSDTLSAIFYPAPTASKISGPDTLHTDSVGNFTINANANSTVIWEVENGHIGSGQNTAIVDIHIDSTGFQWVKAVEITDRGCVGDTVYKQVFVIRPVGLNAYKSLPGIQLFPNPNNGRFVLTGLPVEAEIKIYDETGKWVYRVKADNKSMTIQLPGLPKGLYHIHIRHLDKRTDLKFVVQ